MAVFTDKTKQKNKSVENRKKFLDRHADAIHERVLDIARKKSIKDIGKSDEKVNISKRDLNEPTFNHNPNTGRHDIVQPGNKQYNTGDNVKRPPQQGGGRGNKPSKDGEGEDDFSFVLSKEEYIDILFQDCELPDFVKKSIAVNEVFEMVRGGYTKYGTPSKLHLRKTFEMALARRIAAKNSGKKARFLDDIDLRYRDTYKRPKPTRKAVIFMVMDVSGSMSEQHKDLAKRFFLLLYLFLERSYDQVDIRFVSHTQTAKEVTEEEFFYGKETGGTIVSSALRLVDEIITKDYNNDDYNLYFAQASDGDIFEEEFAEVKSLMDHILPRVQYASYIEIMPTRYTFYNDVKLSQLYVHVAEEHPKMHVRHVRDPDEIFPVFLDLFKKR